MPNHCENELWVIGRPRHARKFVEASRNPDHGKELEDDEWGVVTHRKDRRRWMIFENNHPCPAELRETKSVSYCDEKLQAEQDAAEARMLEKYGWENWYEWCLSNWGTKWGDYDTALVGEGGWGARFSFQTAWSPGTAGLEKISASYPELVFVNAYEEPGCDFIGCSAFHRGTLLYEGHGNFPDGPGGWGDDAHQEAIAETRSKWLGRALAKMEKRTPFHARKFRPIARP